MAVGPHRNEKELVSFQIPPQSLEAEESLLSAILIDNNALLDVLEILSPYDFYKSNHQKIFAAITNLFSRNEPIDLVTVTNQLKSEGQLEAVGGAAYLAALIETVPMAVNAGHYAKIIHDKASLRRLIDKANQITKKCFNDQGDVPGVIDFAESAIFEVSGDKIRRSYYQLKEIIEKNIDTIEERQGNKALITGVPTGFSRLDNLTAGLQKSDLIILAGRPSMGKTAFALNIARNAAVDHNLPIAMFSLEMSKEQLSMRMLCSEAKVNSARLRSGFFSNKDWVDLTDAAGILSDAPIFIDDSPDLSAMEIRAKARRLKMEKGIGLIIIDYLQLMKSRATAERRDLEISEMSRSLKALAKELDLPVLALSQLNRKLEERSDKRPQLSDLRESGALEQDADVVAFIYRDEVYNRDENNPKKGTAEILLRKQRNGPTGDISLQFDDTITCFRNLQDERYLKGFD
jgi:replicative DNA helicase